MRSAIAAACRSASTLICLLELVNEDAHAGVLQDAVLDVLPDGVNIVAPGKAHRGLADVSFQPGFVDDADDVRQPHVAVGIEQRRAAAVQPAQTHVRRVHAEGQLEGAAEAIPAHGRAGIPDQADGAVLSVLILLGEGCQQALRRNQAAFDAAIEVDDFDLGARGLLRHCSP
ncbi:MAG: hypothetical protein ACM336_10810 [Acidobacteriota bacterium]